MRRHRLVVIVVLVLAAALGAALPVFVTGTLSANLTAGGQSVRPATLDCSLPDRMGPDELYPYAGPPPVKLSPLAGARLTNRPLKGAEVSARWILEPSA